MKLLSCTAVMTAFLLLAPTVRAKTMYVNDTIKITMRTGPGIAHKIITMLESGQKMTVRDVKDDWSYIRLPDGRDGWVLTQFLTASVPRERHLLKLQEEQEELLRTVARLTEENEKIKTENEGLASRTETMEAERNHAVQDYEKLKSDSQNYIDIRKKYEKAETELENLREKAAELEMTLKAWKGDLILFGSASLIFFIGFFLGWANSRNRGKSSYLR